MSDLAERLRDWSLAGCEHNIPMDDGRACWPCIRDRLTASTVVLDPDDPDDQRRLATALNRYDADELVRTDDLMRSLLPVVTPPEPNGLGARVIDGDGLLWIRMMQAKPGYACWMLAKRAPDGIDRWSIWERLTGPLTIAHGCSCGAPDCNGGDR